MAKKFIQITSLISVLITSVLGAHVICQPVRAQTETGTLQVEPAFQELAISDNEASLSASLKLTNRSDASQTFELFAVDIKQFDSEGRIILADKPLSGTDYSLTDFIETDQSTWTVPAGESVRIPFTIKNTPKLSPGGHYAALITRLKASPTTTQQVLPAVSSFILVRKIGGELYHLSLVDFNKSIPSFWWSVPSDVQLIFSNQGNIHVTPRGTIQLKTFWGNLAYSGILNVDSLYVFPSTQRSIRTEIRRIGWQWPLMVYNLVVDARSEPGAIPVKQQTTVFVANPYFLLVLGGILLLLLVVRATKK